MNISKSDWANYSNTQEKIRKEAAALMEKWIAKNGTEDRVAMVEFAKALTDKYGEAAGAYACQLFDEVAEAAGIVVTTNMADLATIEEVGMAVNGSLKQSPSGKIVPQVIERLTKQVAEDTMLRNAQRYNAEWAWIPDGGACAYCRMLASQGWQHLSKSLQQNHAEHIHANCNCEFAIRFNRNSGVDGYDPAQLLKEYNSFKGSSKNKVKAWRQELEAITEELTNQ